MKNEFEAFEEIMDEMAGRGYRLILFAGQMYEAAFVELSERDPLSQDCYKSMGLLTAVQGAKDMAIAGSVAKALADTCEPSCDCANCDQGCTFCEQYLEEETK